MKFVFFNDTGRLVKIHPATFHGCITKKEPIKHLEEREFILPEGTYAWTKMWDYEEFGLSIIVTPMTEEK